MKKFKEGHYFCKQCGDITENNWSTRTKPNMFLEFGCTVAEEKGYNPNYCPDCIDKPHGFSGELTCEK